MLSFFAGRGLWVCAHCHCTATFSLACALPCIHDAPATPYGMYAFDALDVNTVAGARSSACPLILMKGGTLLDTAPLAVAKVG